MSERPLVSIITPTYNHENFIANCIESVITQTYENWEMIIIDDGSFDETPKIIEKYASYDSRIRFIRQGNIGIFRLAETYNKALELSSGEYIAILEGDDYWNKNKLEIQLNEFENYPDAILCWGQIITISQDKQTEFGIVPVINREDYKYFNNFPVGSILNILFFKNCIPALTIIIKKQQLIEIGGFRQKYGLPLVDLTTLYELALIGRFIFIPEVLGYWRVYPNQVTKIHAIKIAEGFIALAFEYFNKIKETSLIDPEITIGKIKKNYKKIYVISLSRSGRYNLIRKNFKNARTDYLNSIFNYILTEPIWKLRSLIGLIFSFFHLNVEMLAKWIGRGSLK